MRTAKAFLHGVTEFRHAVTTHYEYGRQCTAYDWGREWAHRLTLRRYEED